MADLMSTDIFKFVAVRPSQLATEVDTRFTMMRDRRASTPDGRTKLRALAEPLASRKMAVGAWQQQDLTPLRSWATGYRDLLARYNDSVADDQWPAIQGTVAELRLVDIPDNQLNSAEEDAWNALYVAYATGPDAGLRLEVPTAALRTIHFVQAYNNGLLQRSGQNDAVKDVIVALLGATPLVPEPIYSVIQSPSAANGMPGDVDVTGRIRPLGIGDLKVVKQFLVAYTPGEVAHIENVLQGESKQRTHRALDRNETTLVTSEEDTQDAERDTQTTDRFEVKKEAEQTIKDDMSVQAGVTVSSSFGPVTMSAQGNFSYSTSKQQSEKTSSNFARDIVDRSVTKVQKKMKTERTTKTFQEVEETNTHGLDNKTGSQNVVGIYRWVDKKYRAQMYNYGVRLMFEFIVPEPAAFFRASMLTALAIPSDIVPPPPFVEDKDNKTPITAMGDPSDNTTGITPLTYLKYASRYNASGITPPPLEQINVSTVITEGGLDTGKSFSKETKELIIDKGYRATYIEANVAAVYVQGVPELILQVGDTANAVLNLANADIRQWTQKTFSNQMGQGGFEFRGYVPITVTGYDIVSYAINVTAKCERDQATYETWQLQTFDKIYAAYKAMKDAYDQKVTQVQARGGGIIIEGRNPEMNREIEKRELKKFCITMLTGQQLHQFDAMGDPLPQIDVLKALDQGPFIQFFEQAFDWDQITYLFYPYFWGRASNWAANSLRGDPDPLFTEFLQAGSARVVVPVTLHYNEAMLYFISTPGAVADKIWQGGEPPVLDDPLYVSIAEEIKHRTDDLENATPEGKPWEYTIPTTLVWLQPEKTLPKF